MCVVVLYIILGKIPTNEILGNLSRLSADVGRYGKFFNAQTADCDKVTWSTWIRV